MRFKNGYLSIQTSPGAEVSSDPVLSVSRFIIKFMNVKKIPTNNGIPDLKRKKQKTQCPFF